ncbi:hypothetical protein ACVW1B_004423 [Bradyrhizobium sp. USDA 4502]|nr:hypothetical protein [Bradyrhizobium sp. USDA 4545]MCP1916480.1 hypothetical protein [Bradyrhizobium sp. USDA 4532]
MMKPFIQLRKGDSVRNKKLLTDAITKFWRFGSECSSLGGGLMPATVLLITEISTRMGDQWVKLEIPGRSPKAMLKVAGEELPNNFDLA